jgi:hypothetical protein
MAEDENIHQPLAYPESGEADIRTKALIGAIVVFAVVVITASLATWLLVKDWSEPGPATTLPSRPFPAPNVTLQIAPPLDMAELQAREDSLLHRTEWIDQERGIVRIPIEQAMALLAKRAGAAARPSGPQGTSPSVSPPQSSPAERGKRTMDD